MLDKYDLLGAFWCSAFEEEILKTINAGLRSKRYPDFKKYNRTGVLGAKCQNCRKKTSCHYDEKAIISRLKETGVWQKIDDCLAVRK